MQRAEYDIVIVGSGPGGGTLAYGLRNSGAHILLIERGDFLPQEPENWSAAAIFSEGRYRTADRWQDNRGRSFQPGVHYFVGGNTKFFGAALPRFRPRDFEATEHANGISPGWPISYAELAPYYRQAEIIYVVHGEDDDPWFPRGEPFPYPAVPHEPAIQRLTARLRAAGYTPSTLPLGIDLGPAGRCIRCATCDGFPCRVLAKADAEVCCVRPALQHSNIELLVRTYARRILTDASGKRAVALEVVRNGEVSSIKAGVVVVSCGAVNSAALLLRSANSKHAKGLANGSDMVGRHYMVHNNSLMMTLNPFDPDAEPVTFQKTFYINDYYSKGTTDHPYPLGQIQMIGKIQAEMLAAYARFMPRVGLRYFAKRSVDWWLFSEDLPDPANRVTLTSSNTVQLRWRPNNLRAHAVLTREASRMATTVGYPLVFTRRTGIAFNSHQSGTVRAGTDPAISVLDPSCRAHEIENLFVVDSSFFPSLPPMNPVLTIAANALRVAESLSKQ
jgi:choline dehydrogenase-like flavoprotein